MLERSSPIVERVLRARSCGQRAVVVIAEAATKDRERTSTEFERQLDARAAARFPTRASTSVAERRRRQRAATSRHARRRRSRAAAPRPRSKLVERWQRLEVLVAPRIAGDLQRPEIMIKPRLDLAADLGVTTAALSQTIRIATLGDIDQNSAKFSLSRPPGADPRRAVRRVARATSRRSRTCRCRPRAAARCR